MSPDRRRPRRLVRARRGIALVTVMVIAVVAVTLALASSMLVMGNVLVQNASERTTSLDDAALSGLEEARNRLNARLDSVPLSGYRTIESNVQPPNTTGVRRSTWVARVGNPDSLSNAGEFGVQAEIVSQATDVAGNSAVRRALIYQSSFARYAYFTDVGRQANGATLWFANQWTAQGPLHSNDSLYIFDGTPPQAIFKDVVTTAKGVYNPGDAQWDKGPAQIVAPIPMPGTADLDLLKTIAARANYVFTPTVSTGDSALTTMRIEFLTVDLDGDGLGTSEDEGFFRVYETRAANPYGDGYTAARTQATPAFAWATASLDSMLYSPNCGVTTLVGGLTAITQTFRRIPEVTSTTVYNTRMAAKQAAFDNGGARCYLGGDPRLNPAGLFIATDSAGGWLPRPNGITVPAAVSARPDGAYLFPLSPNFNPNFRGAIFVEGKVGVSGVVNGRVTLAARNTLVVLSDLTQATSPATTTGTCQATDDIVGLFSGENVLWADNSLQAPQRRTTGGPGTSWTSRKEFDPSPNRPDLAVHAVILALRSIATERPAPVGDWVDRGFVRQVGGRIQQRAGTGGTISSGVRHGYTSDISFNRCAMTFPPPYFPTTSRWALSQYFELDPQNFTPARWFAGR